MHSVRCYRKYAGRMGGIMDATVILGAGFSKNSGLPVQSEISRLLFSGVGESGFEQALTQVLKEFTENTFGCAGTGSIPDIEDLFTCMDISTNSGHHLGIGYGPMELRAIRRFLVYRVFSILERSFRNSSAVESLIKALNEAHTHVNYVVLNWDTVLEYYLLKQSRSFKVDYCNGGTMLESGNTSRGQERTVKLLKLHGSCNWLYCDNCRVLFYDLYNKVPLIRKSGFLDSDFALFDSLKEYKDEYAAGPRESCILCRNRISAHIATFSYRKSFRTNSFPRIWEEAERLLAGSQRWIFIGYSLPAADYEFKHLLKISELKYRHMKERSLEMDVVLLHSDAAADRYRGFFGNRLHRIFNEGVDEYSEYLRGIGPVHSFRNRLQ